MKTPTRQSLLAALVVLFSFRLSPLAFAQGSLTPPGAPAPTMKTLAQIEPRTPISLAPFTISSSGSYYLTTNLAVTSGDAITIDASNVTLDLNGFVISSTANPASGNGITLGNSSTVTNIAIYNGNISGSVANIGGIYDGVGFGFGIYYTAGSPYNARVRGVSVSGCLHSGIYLFNGMVESCVVRTAGDFGIVASSVSNSTAEDCGNNGVWASTAIKCSGISSGIGSGVLASAAINCFGSSLGTGSGVVAATAINCYGVSIKTMGLSAIIANNCYGASSGSGAGVFAVVADNCYGFSHSGTGVSATTVNNCNGFSAGDGTGVFASTTATGSCGVSTSGIGVSATTANGCYGSSTYGTGVYASIANSCYGTSPSSGSGLSASTANNCYGTSSSNTGLFASGTATGCQGHSDTGIGLFAFIANVCHGSTSSGTALSTPHNVNSF